ncbi:MAG: MBL fold metallo-hydrolase [Candidatus Delongbacteria bacterium]|nr:MBL fold metallo-hydrolase [Candidatus Delongbacteria bacterium]
MKLLQIDCGHLVAPGQGRTLADGHRERLLLPVNQAILIFEDCIVAFDSGLRFEDFRPRHGGVTLQPPAVSPREQLTAAGINEADVTHLLLTHGHYDHCGGLIDRYGAAIYPRAKIVIHSRELELFAVMPPESDRFYDGCIASFLKQTDLQLLCDGAGQVAGVEYQHTGGHTAGHVMYHYRGMVFSGDLLPLASSVLHLKPHEFDCDPEEATSWRRRLQQGEFGRELFLCHGSNRNAIYHL